MSKNYREIEVEKRIDFPARISRLQRLMSEEGIDVLLATSLPSLAYVADIYQNLAWYPNTAAVVPPEGEPILIVPLSDKRRVASETWLSTVLTWNPEFAGYRKKSFDETLVEALEDLKLGAFRLGLESSTGWPLYQTLSSRMNATTITSVDLLLQECMMIKEPAEIELMRKAASLCVAGYEAARDAIKPGMTENELAGVMEQAMRKEGCTGFWVPNQVGAGPIVLMDHYPSDTVIQSDHYVKVGIHPDYKLYRGDICNVFALKRADDEYRSLCGAVEEASLRTIDAMRPGTKSSELFAIYNHVMEELGFPGVCNWYIGHGLGTGHQRPLISPEDDTILKENMIIILNALAQPENKNGFMNEIMLLVTADGAERLSSNPLGLVQL